jgi:hypothetical protein
MWNVQGLRSVAWPKRRCESVVNWTKFSQWKVPWSREYLHRLNNYPVLKENLLTSSQGKHQIFDFIMTLIQTITKINIIFIEPLKNVVKVEVTLQLTVNQAWCWALLGLMTRFPCRIWQCRFRRHGVSSLTTGRICQHFMASLIFWSMNFI